MSEQTSNQIVPFRFQNHEIRTLSIDGNPWFVAADVCAVLGLGNVQMALGKVPDNHKTLNSIEGKNWVRDLNIISEAGLYRLVLRSDKPQAEPFIEWVTSEVLPAIRRTGGYIHATTEESPEVILARAVLVANDTIERMKIKTVALEAQAKTDRPKVIFADAVDASKTSILIGDMAKLLRQNGVADMGQNRFFEWLRNNGYLIHARGTAWNMPTQRSMEAGLFEIKETTIAHADGHTSISRTAKVTGRGQIYFINKFQPKFRVKRIAAVA